MHPLSKFLEWKLQSADCRYQSPLSAPFKPPAACPTGPSLSAKILSSQTIVQNSLSMFNIHTCHSIVVQKGRTKDLFIKSAYSPVELYTQTCLGVYVVKLEFNNLLITNTANGAPYEFFFYLMAFYSF